MELLDRVPVQENDQWTSMKDFYVLDLQRLEERRDAMHIVQTFQIPTGSVVDPNTLNLDQDPEFWPNLYQDPDPQHCLQASTSIGSDNATVL